MGQSPPGESCNEIGNGTPLLNGPTEFGASTPTPVQYTTNAKKYSEPSDILFCVRGSTTGRMNWSDRVYAIGRGLAALRHKRGEKYRYFLKALIEYQLPFLLQSATGSTFPNVSKEQLNRLPITVPDLGVQETISEILSSLDDKIELNNKINQELEALAQAIFKHWFIDFEFPDENGQPYKSSGGEMIESELGEIPKGWSISAFAHHIEAAKGLSYKGSGLTDASNGKPMINLNSVYEGGGYKYEGIKYYSGEFKERHAIKPWDIAVANTEQGHKYLLIGYPAVIPKAIGDVGIFTHHIYRVRIKPSSFLTNQFVYYLILQPSIREQIIGACNGTTVNMLKIQGLEMPKFAVPSQVIIEKYSRLIEPIWDAKETNHGESKYLQDLRNTLLPKLVSGEVQLRDVVTENLM